VYVAHLLDRHGRSRYAEYHTLIIDTILEPCFTDGGLEECRYVRTDPPEHDDLGLPIFRERA
jgi:hypothetical protein